MKHSLSFLALLGVCVLPSIAEAHIKMLMPMPRHTGTPPLKEAPCGVAGEKRSKIINQFKPGETITVAWNEFVSHPGHFRIAFLQDGDAFNDPKSYTDIETTPVLPILADGLFEHKAGPDGKDYSMQIKLPNVTCDNCTLQLIQIMTDKAPYTLGGNDVYHECADIVLAGDGSGGADAGGDAPAADAGGSDDAESGTGGAGSSAGTGGSSGTGGSGGSGTAGTGGSSSSTGGSTGSAGSTGSGGTSSGSGGSSSGSGGSKGGSGGSGGSKTSSGGGSSSGGCSFGGNVHTAEPAGLALIGLAFAIARRRRRR